VSEEDAENARAAGVEVCWVDTRLQRQAAGLNGVAVVVFEDAVPVRNFPRTGVSGTSRASLRFDEVWLTVALAGCPACLPQVRLGWWLRS